MCIEIEAVLSMCKCVEHYILGMWGNVTFTVLPFVEGVTSIVIISFQAPTQKF